MNPRLRRPLRGVKGALRAPSPNASGEVPALAEYSSMANFAASPEVHIWSQNKIEP